jgi:1,4-dihydroxy-2-naphthoate octaprenyltransferase
MTFKPIRAIANGAKGQLLIPVLGATGRLEMMYGLLLVIGLAISR